jgi:hypothetical protein
MGGCFAMCAGAWCVCAWVGRAEGSVLDELGRSLEECEDCNLQHGWSALRPTLGTATTIA